MADPFISRDRRADLMSYLASSASTEDAEATNDAEAVRRSYNKLYSKEQQKDQKDSKDGKDSKDSSDGQGFGGLGVDEIIRAAGADAAAADEAGAGMSVGNKWVKPAELGERDPVV